ncbi:hypothetical protein DEU56DRAFT_762605 [Suillus clintonianus]|uniref:uncharacterized protein n=1 Tax=Suillus clintonianus TaxID=1904413 RepID=UPI001B86BFFF|nr:uncharacterized protein DEU56DRAFT_762605 [Suillus clintonianus]KAG2107603.1 hypothetical protein DEU56DRAFT_762605 [Suillus clintonianus]
MGGQADMKQLGQASQVQKARDRLVVRQAGMQDGQASQRKATTVESKALTLSECTLQSAGPPRRQNALNTVRDQQVVRHWHRQNALNKVRDQQVLRYITRSERAQANVKEEAEGKGSQRQVTTVNLKALASPECTQQSAGPTSLKANGKEEGAGKGSQRQVTTVNSTALASPECTQQSAGPTSLKNALNKVRDQQVLRYVTRSERAQANVKEEEEGEASQRQVTTVNSKALASPECTQQSAGPTSLKANAKEEGAGKGSQRQVTAVNLKALASPECTQQSAGPTSLQVTAVLRAPGDGHQRLVGGTFPFFTRRVLKPAAATVPIVSLAIQGRYEGPTPHVPNIVGVDARQLIGGIMIIVAFSSATYKLYFARLDDVANISTFIAGILHHTTSPPPSPQNDVLIHAALCRSAQASTQRIVLSQWHISSHLQFVFSFLAIVALGMLYEYLRVYSRDFDTCIAEKLRGGRRMPLTASWRSLPEPGLQFSGLESVAGMLWEVDDGTFVLGYFTG